MSLTERTLKKWRKEALCFKKIEGRNEEHKPISTTGEVLEAAERILQMTQELLDQHLLRKG